MVNYFVLFCILSTTPFLIHAQLGHDDSNNSSDICECVPSCNNTTLGPLDCENGQLAPRVDCPCCHVCLKQEGESCQEPENPCDKLAGLTCSPKGICQGTSDERNLTQVRSTCRTDEDCPDTLFCLGQKCSDPCPILSPCEGHLKGGVCTTRKHQPKCECPKGTIAKPEAKACHPIAEQQGLKPTGIPEKETKPQSKFSSKLDVIQVKVSTQNSTTLILPSSAGGVLHYKESRSDIEASKLAVGESDGSVVTITGLTPSTRYTIKWAGNDGTSSKSEIKTEDGCLQSGMSYPVGAKWHEGCQTTCSCHLGGVSECKPRCVLVAGSVQDDQCEEQPSRSDPECCVEYNCKKGDNSVLDTASVIGDSSGATQLTDPKLIVTSRTHNSVTVAWDDFRAGNPDNGYVTEYREVPQVPIDTKIPWMKKETSSVQPLPPTMTIGKLKPNTQYEVRVGIYSNEKDRNLNAATETIKVRTEPGCVYGNTSFGVGEFFQGCEERCSCSKEGSVKCSKRCSIPYFKKGTFADDPYCTEDNEDSDECCVLVMCAHGENRGEDQVLLDFDQCANTVCGNNAECVSWPTISDSNDGHKLPQPGSCRCKEGFSGNPSDLIVGCVSDPDAKTEENSCSFKHTLYSPGDVFYDGCAYKCTCNSKRELECQPRCKFPSDEGHNDSSCTYLPDPDDSCCLTRVCNSTTDEDRNISPALAFDGCTYGNKTYSKDEAFTFGCESKCLCMGFGDVSCFPRCPPMKEKFSSKGVICETLLDPEDKCCNITLCDDTVPDIMKSNVTENDSLSLLSKIDDKLMETTTVMMDEDDGNITLSEMSEDKMNETSEIEGRILHRPQHVLALSDENNNTTREEVYEPPFIKKFIYQTGGNETEEMVNTTMTDTFRPIHFPEEMTTTVLPMHHEIDEEVLNVTQTDQQDFLMKKPRFEDILIPKIEVSEIVPVDSSTVKMTVRVSQAILTKLLSGPNEEITVTYSHDSLTWKNQSISVDAIIVENMYDIVFQVPDLETQDSYQFRVIYDDIVSPIKKVSLSTSAVVSDPLTIRHDSCEFKGRFYKPGEDFYDDCRQFCQCNDDLKVHCGFIECPQHFGLDILDPGCLEWEDDPEYVPVPPRCCGSMPKCALHINDLSCTHQGVTINHLDFVPKELADCDQRCQCMRGSLECETLCSPVPATPPFHLDCHASEARLTTKPTFPCCREWQCKNSSDTDEFIPMPEGPNTHENSHINMAGPPSPPPGISMPIIHKSEDGVHLYFNIPSTFVGLPGGIYLRYTPDSDYNPSPLHWESEVIHEDGVTLDRAQWQYAKRNLLPGTNYTMQLVLSTHISKSEIVSPHFYVFTPPAGEPEEVEVDTEMTVDEITNSTARISWRPFSDGDQQYIAYLQVRYTSKNDKVWLLVNPTADHLILEDLKPGTKYMASLVILSHPGSPVHLVSPHNVTFETVHGLADPKTTPLPHLDLDAELSVSDIQNTSVKISWKNFDNLEMQYIDGIRVRFWPENKRFPEEGPMLHREADNMILRDLEPGTKYTVDLFFIPHEGLTSTISNTKNISFTTLPKLKDKYAFNITIAAGEISEDGVKILYSGVAEPEGKYINVYRVVYTSDGDSQDSQKFKVPKNQKDGYITLVDLKPGIEYEVWLEAYLTNGGKKKSNVITVETSYGQSLQPEKSEIIKSKELRQDGDVSYYSAFVAVAILVAIACLIIIGLLFVLMRRQNHAKAHINSSKGVAAYDNPSYKTSENSYAMEMNGLKNTTNGNSLQNEEP